MTIGNRALDTTGAGLALRDLPPFEAGRIDPRGWFPDPARRLEIEIGSGKGTFLVESARARPDVNLLGIEQALEYWRHAADRVRRHGLAGVRVLHGDATAFLRWWCAGAVAAAIHLYFSDPWPKKRHHKRRVVQDATLVEFHRVLAPGGVLHLVTDHDELWAWYEAHAARAADRFERRSFDAVAGEPGELVGTNYERKFRREGRPFHAMTLVART